MPHAVRRRAAEHAYAPASQRSRPRRPRRVADLATDHVAHGGAESDARALERVSTKQNRPPDRARSVVLRADPRRRAAVRASCRAARASGARAMATCERIARRSCFAPRPTSFRPLLPARAPAEALCLSGERGEIARPTTRFGKAREEAFEISEPWPLQRQRVERRGDVPRERRNR